VGVETTLRYAVQMLTPAAICARLSNRKSISKADIKETSELFIDGKSSALMLKENDQKYMH